MKERSEKRGREKKMKAFFIIANLLISIIAFTFLVSLASVEVVSGAGAEVWNGIPAGAQYEYNGLYYKVQPNQPASLLHPSSWFDSTKAKYWSDADSKWVDSKVSADMLSESNGFTPVTNAPSTGMPTPISSSSGPIVPTSFPNAPQAPTPAQTPSAPANPPITNVPPGTNAPAGAGALVTSKVESALLSDGKTLTSTKQLTQFSDSSGTYLADGATGNYYKLGTNGFEKIDNVPENIKSATEKAGTNTPAPPESGWASMMKPGGIISTALNGLLWGGIGALIGSFMGGNGGKAGFVAGLAGGLTSSILGSGLNIGSSQIIKPGFGSSTLASYAPVIGIAVAVVVFVMMYKKESKKQVTFTCMPWQAPVGGADCEKCNAGPEPCSQYRCKALGQACELLNEGLGNESCTWVNRHDVKSPGIKKWDDVLTNDHSYTNYRERPEGGGSVPGGYTIIRNGDSQCIKAFTPLTFGIMTNKPAKCKIDYNHTQKFDEMSFWFGETNLFLYNHTQTLSLPGPTTFNESGSPEIMNDGTFTLYVRCMDANGNENTDEFAVRFCVDKGPDTTAPLIVSTSIANNAPIKYNQTSLQVEVYVNEPATCKWSREDRTYDGMENSMSCATNVWEMNNNQVYTCIANLSGLKDRQDNEYYFKCRDQPFAPEEDRNTNQESYKFVLKGTQPLNIVAIRPNGTISDSTDTVAVNLEVETANGFEKGNAYCYYSRTGNEADYLQFFETGGNKHTQRQDLTPGSYTYYVKCLDLGGNRDDNSTSFTISVDRTAPQVVRVYNSGGDLKIVTSEKSTCSYSQAANQLCNFDISKGTMMSDLNSTEHLAPWKPNTNYYIRCMDKYGNQPYPNDCSAIVRAYNNAQLSS